MTGNLMKFIRIVQKYRNSKKHEENVLIHILLTIFYHRLQRQLEDRHYTDKLKEVPGTEWVDRAVRFFIQIKT